MSEAAGPHGAPATSDALAGSSWVIRTIDGQAVTGLEAVSVEFGHDGRVTGSMGTNRFTASYSMSTAYLTIGPMATTRRGGEPEQMAEEHRVVASLAGMCSFELDDRRLAIAGPMGWVELDSTAPPRPQLPPDRSDPEALDPSG